MNSEFQSLADAIYRERVLRARQTPPEERLLDGIRLYDTLDGIDLRPDIPRLQQRALVMHGTADRIQPIEESRWLAAHLPRSRLIELEGAGHVPTMTHGAEVASAINAYFQP